MSSVQPRDFFKFLFKHLVRFCEAGWTEIYSLTIRRTFIYSYYVVTIYSYHIVTIYLYHSQSVYV